MLRNKLIGVSLVPMLIIFVSFGFIVYGSIRQELEDELGRRLLSIGQVASAQLSHSVNANQISRLDASKKRVIARFQKRVDDLKNSTGIERAMIFFPDHRSIADTDGTPFGANIYVLDAHKAEIEKSFQDHSTTSVLFAKKSGFDKIGFVPIQDEHSVVAVIAIVGSAQYFEILNDLATLLLLLSLASLLIIVVSATYFSKRITNPVDELLAATRRLGRGELEDSIQVNSNDEIGVLGRAFDDMRCDILQRDEQMQMMLSGIAHEVRNPLGGMSLFLGLLKEDLEEDKEGHQQELQQVSKIRRELVYLEDVVSDFLNFAKNSPLQVERFPALIFFEEISELLKGDSDQKEIKIEIILDRGVQLIADREKLKSAMINVIRNACQACTIGSKITIEVQVEPNFRKVLVKDTGPGISDDVLKNIFTPFYTTKEKGSGLGLALTQRIIKQHRGTLEIETKLGLGTEIYFRLPYSEAVETQEIIPEGWLG